MITSEKEAEVKTMERLCDDFEKGTITERILSAIPEIAEKVAEREKLKYRLKIMQKAISTRR